MTPKIVLPDGDPHMAALLSRPDFAARLDHRAVRAGEWHVSQPIAPGALGRHLLDHRRGVRLVARGRANPPKIRSRQVPKFGE